jgi:prepilin signal peptidase PulO-like enzyme (type II secretory pathway)
VSDAAAPKSPAVLVPSGWKAMVEGLLVLIWILQSILIFLLSFYSLFIRSGPGLLLRIEGAVLCGGLLEGIRLISRGGIGMGDVKLMTACGFFLGITTGAVSLVFAYILAGMFCLPLLIFKKASLKTRLPMAPFFTVSILIFLFFEEKIFTWYLGLWGIL